MKFKFYKFENFCVSNTRMLSFRKQIFMTFYLSFDEDARNIFSWFSFSEKVEESQFFYKKRS